MACLSVIFSLMISSMDILGGFNSLELNMLSIMGIFPVFPDIGMLFTILGLMHLVGGFNPSEQILYSQVGTLPQIEMKIEKRCETTT